MSSWKLTYEDEFGQMAIFPDYFGEAPVRSFREDFKLPHGTPEGCFGYVNGQLYLGERHHLAIMNHLIESGMTFEELMEAQQVWGWIHSRNIPYFMGEKTWEGDNFSWPAYEHDEDLYIPVVSFTSDAARIDKEGIEDAVRKLEEYWGVKFFADTNDMYDAAENYGIGLDYKYQDPDAQYRDRPDEAIRRAKWKLAQTFSEIKFVSLPDKMLVGENTYHARLLMVEYGDNMFPHDTLAIGRALVKDDTVVEVSFDFVVDPAAKEHAQRQLEEYTESQEYLYDPQERGWLQGLAATKFEVIDVAPGGDKSDSVPVIYDRDHNVFYVSESNAGHYTIYDYIYEQGYDSPSAEYHGYFNWNEPGTFFWYDWMGRPDDELENQLLEAMKGLGAKTSATTSIAWAVVGGRVYYGDFHAEIVQKYFPNFDLDQLEGVFGYMTKAGKEWDVSVYSDFMIPNQKKDDKSIDRALQLLGRDIDIRHIVRDEVPAWAEGINEDPFLDDPYMNRDYVASSSQMGLKWVYNVSDGRIGAVESPIYGVGEPWDDRWLSHGRAMNALMQPGEDGFGDPDWVAGVAGDGIVEMMPAGDIDRGVRPEHEAKALKALVEAGYIRGDERVFTGPYKDMILWRKMGRQNETSLIQ